MRAVVAVMCLGLSLLALPKPALADDPLENMLSREERPTVKEFLEWYQSAYGKLKKGSFASYLDIGGEVHDAAKVIGEMEYIFPGSRWVTMGRDTDSIADILEAFYLHMGQTDRVVRLPVSSDSFSDTTNEILVEFLRDYGLCLENIEQQRPFTFLDRTSYSMSGTESALLKSQSRRLLDAVYEAYAKQGGERANLLRRVNILSLNTYNWNVSDSSSITTFDGPSVKDFYFHDQRRVFEAQVKTQERVHSFGPSKILTLRSDFSLTDKQAWHGTFGPIERFADGKLGTIRGDAASVDDRKGVLTRFSHVLPYVMTDDFAKRVQARYQQLSGRSYNVHLEFDGIQLGPLTFPPLTDFDEFFTNIGKINSGKKRRQLMGWINSRLVLASGFPQYQSSFADHVLEFLSREVEEQRLDMNRFVSIMVEAIKLLPLDARQRPAERMLATLAGLVNEQNMFNDRFQKKFGEAIQELDSEFRWLKAGKARAEVMNARLGNATGMLRDGRMSLEDFSKLKLSSFRESPPDQQWIYAEEWFGLLVDTTLAQKHAQDSLIRAFDVFFGAVAQLLPEPGRHELFKRALIEHPAFLDFWSHYTFMSASRGGDIESLNARMDLKVTKEEVREIKCTAVFQ